MLFIIIILIINIDNTDRSTHMSPYMKKLRDEMAESLSTTVTDNSNNNTLSECRDNTMMEESLEKLNIESCKGDVGRNSNDTEDDDSDDDDDEEDDDDPSKYMGKYFLKIKEINAKNCSWKNVYYHFIISIRWW